MKKIYPILILVLLPIYGYAQDCKLDVDETDAFTKEHVRSGTNGVGGKLWHWTLTLKQSGSTMGWAMQIKYGKIIQAPIAKGDIIYCKMENDKVVKLVADNDYAPSHVAAGDGFVLTTFLPSGSLTPEEMKDFSESPMSGIRVTLAGKALEPDVSSKQGRNIQEIAQCILKK